MGDEEYVIILHPPIPQSPSPPRGGWGIGGLGDEEYLIILHPPRGDEEWGMKNNLGDEE